MDSVERLRSGQLWSEFCDALKLAGDQVLVDSVPGDDLTRAEGYRYLTRLLRLSLEKNIEFGDPNFPPASFGQPDVFHFVIRFRFHGSHRNLLLYVIA